MNALIETTPSDLFRKSPGFEEDDFPSFGPVYCIRNVLAGRLILRHPSKPVLSPDYPFPDTSGAQFGLRLKISPN